LPDALLVIRRIRDLRLVDGGSGCGDLGGLGRKLRLEGFGEGLGVASGLALRSAPPSRSRSSWLSLEIRSELALSPTWLGRAPM